VAVELDDQALRTPDAVTLDQAAGDLHGGIDLRPREADALEEREEALLKVAAGGVLAGASGGDDTAERRRAAAAGVAGEEPFERDEVAEPPDLGLLKRPLELAAREDRREVEESPGGGCDRNPLLLGHLVVGKPRVMNLDARPRPTPRHRGDLWASRPEGP